MSHSILLLYMSIRWIGLLTAMSAGYCTISAHDSLLKPEVRETRTILYFVLFFPIVVIILLLGAIQKVYGEPELTENPVLQVIQAFLQNVELSVSVIGIVAIFFSLLLIDLPSRTLHPAITHEERRLLKVAKVALLSCFLSVVLSEIFNAFLVFCSFNH